MDILSRILLLSFVILISVCLGKSEITIQNNGYSGIVVAFSHLISEQEGKPLIPKVKELFTKASPYLYSATYGRAYFKKVNILIPQTWSKVEGAIAATDETFGSAAVRIDKANPTYGDAPYTLQIMGCGHPGDHIHLTPGYLKNLNGNSTELFGNPGSTLVHEWAHYRYGIFDEYGFPGDRDFPMFYLDERDEDVYPNYCADKKINGRFWNIDKNIPCLYGNDGLPDKNCYFEPDMKENNIVTSLASYHYLPKVSFFCNKTNHNIFSPNKHNLLCNHKSTWEIIESNEDLKNTKPIPISNLTPEFVIVQPMELTFVLVLDTSGSMNSEIEKETGYSRMAMLQDTIKRWIKEEVKYGWAVGIVSFSTKVNVADTHPIAKISNEAEKNALINKVPKTANGATCIGCGLQHAQKQLKTYRNGLGGTIILVTDGEENRLPNIINVMPSIKQNKIRVISIAFTKKSSKLMEQLAAETGGKAFFVSEKAGTQAMGSAFYEAVVYQESNSDPTVKISDIRYDKPASIINGSFVIDSTIGNNTVLSFAYRVSNDIISIKIYGPTAADITPAGNQENANSSVSEDPLLKLKRYNFKYLAPGRYNYSIERTSKPNQEIIVNVLSKSTLPDTLPITTRSWIAEQTTSNFHKRLVAYAEVKQGTHPVIRATVIAKIDRPDGSSVQIQLLDNGNGSPDIVRNDGIYSKYFTQLTTAGRYTVKATVVGNKKSSIREMGFTASRSMPIANKYMADTLKTKDKPTGDFERISDSGTFTSNAASTVDSLPPAKVFDLRVAQIFQENSSIVLEWIAPGDDLDDGQAAEYDLRYSEDYLGLLEEFNGTTLKISKPLPAGSIEKHTIKLPDLPGHQSISFALRTADEIPNWSDTSNIVLLHWKTMQPSKLAAKKSNGGLIAGIVVGVIMVIIVATAIAWMVYKKMKD